jgi:DNA modification methylase
MFSEHRIHFADAKEMADVASQSIHLVVTSPPYPMIEMWDALFCRHPATQKALHSQTGPNAFEQMHRQLDRVWDELHRVLVPGGIACINIGDATRTMNNEFALYPNHSRILTHMLKLGFTNLPNILWRKQTNAPNKFMGSGMMPPGAYVTLEHEYVLIFRNGGKRPFNSQKEKINRRQSAFFWEERNRWFSDVWMDLKGTRQKTADNTLRKRSGAYPFELAYRLICMFSVMGDTVLDPFLGTGTTLLAAAVAGRNSVGYELETAFQSLIGQGCHQIIKRGRQRIGARFDDHLQFVRNREAAGQPIKHTNRVYGFPVITRQESEMMIPLPTTIQETTQNQFTVSYAVPEHSTTVTPPAVPAKPIVEETGQLSLFE